MANQTLNISLSTPVYDDSDYVIIEQEPWGKDVGRTSNAQGVLAIGSMIFGGNLPLANCGGLSAFNTPVYVYPSRRTLQFRFKVTHGEHRSGAVGTVMREEVIQCSLQDSVETDYPVSSMYTMQWIGKCYDENGNVTGRPTVTRKGRSLFFNKKVYGSVRVRYSVYRKTYNVRIEERDDSIENNFDCVAYCRWTGGVEFKEITAPNGYDETKGNCGNGLYGNNGYDENGGLVKACHHYRTSLPAAVKADRYTEVNYCSQLVTKDKIVEKVDYDYVNWCKGNCADVDNC